MKALVLNSGKYDHIVQQRQIDVLRDASNRTVRYDM